MLRSSSLLPSDLLLSTFLPRFPSAPFALTQVSTALRFRVQYYRDSDSCQRSPRRQEVTLGDAQRMAKMRPVRVPRILPVVLSPDEVARLLAAAGNLKHQTALAAPMAPACAQAKWWR